MATLDLFGNFVPDEFTREIETRKRPAMVYERPAARVTDRTIEIRDGARMLCRASKDGYAEGSRFVRHGGAPTGATSPGRNALMGWGDKPPVKGLLQMQIEIDNAPKRKRKAT